MTVTTRHSFFLLGLVLVTGLLFGSLALQAADTFTGKRLYLQNCAFCHGKTGRGVMAGAVGFASGWALYQPDMQLLQRIKSGKGVCPAFAPLLNNQEILDVIAFIRTLQ